MIHIKDYIRDRCCLSSSMKFDLCLISNGEPLKISSIDSKLVYLDKCHSLSCVRCILTKIDGLICILKRIEIFQMCFRRRKIYSIIK